MGTKMAVAFANIFMAKIEREILRQSNTAPIFWKRFIDDIISMWDASRDKIEEFLLKANSFNLTIKFTAEVSETETIFLDTVVYKGDRFLKESILDVRTYFKPTETRNMTDMTVGLWFSVVNLSLKHAHGIFQTSFLELKANI